MSAKRKFLAAACFFVLLFGLTGTGLAAQASSASSADPSPGEVLSGRTSEETPNPAFYLLGKSFTLRLEDGGSIIYHFSTKNTLDWQRTWAGRPDRANTLGTATDFIVTNPRPNIYFIDYLDDSAKPSKPVTIIMDLGQNIATVLYGILPTQEELAITPEERVKQNLPLSLVRIEVLHAGISSLQNTKTVRHSETADLVGKRMRYDYRSGDVYEHQYKSETLFTWICLDGMEKGKTDSEACRTYKIADQLYFFIWWEKTVPTLGALILDLKPESMHTVGKLAGFSDAEQTNVVSVVIDAKASILE
ncbi:MAG: molybdenum cofactor biosynthesis F family protein [Deltaproteobacteria bacterium]|jgi:hypothetical protein|nr:molybdenum cofactor biosynthesis F family protein [Deltaproteobacteria bacterium]